MTRLIVTIGTCIVLFSGLAMAATAQDATPASGLADFGLPELNVTVNGTGYEGVSEQIDAGRYLVTATATDDTAEAGGGSISFVQPVGATAEEYLLAVAPPDADATPSIEGVGELPAFVYESTYAGGAFVPAGQSAQMVIDLTPGEWIVWGGDASAPWQPVIFEATGEMPTDLPEPEASAAITMEDHSFTVSDGQLIAGSQVIRIDNTGAQMHHVSAGRTIKGITRDDVLAVLQSEMTGTPAAVEFNPDEDFQPVFFSNNQSSGTSMWIAVDLQPGPHILICFVMDSETGLPHAYLGMVEVVEVGG
ncbi:MAG: hypothetical protein M3440_09620 [Chloroflexota bacterium]|nr:hypothetical protein [Chloroflexota bacterium]